MFRTQPSPPALLNPLVLLPSLHTKPLPSYRLPLHLPLSLHKITVKEEMGNSSDRTRKRIHLWKKALLHFSLCFVMGFFTGIAPTSTTGVLNRSILLKLHPDTDAAVEPTPIPTAAPAPANRNVAEQELCPQQQLIVITITRSTDPFQEAFLWRLANTLRLVNQPLLWIVMEAYYNAGTTEKMLRKTGVMYRHITYKENFTDAKAEAYHQRNVALNHVEHHLLSGIVHFASTFNIYPLQFFEEIREVEIFGTWPVAMVSASRKRVVVEGPICSSSKVIGWQSKELGNDTILSMSPIFSSESDNVTVESRPPARINISGFAFNSSILWDPERWGRPSSIPHSSQDSIRYVHQAVMEDETKIRAIPADCSKVMMWHLHIQRPSSQI